MTRLRLLPLALAVLLGLSACGADNDEAATRATSAGSLTADPVASGSPTAAPPEVETTGAPATSAPTGAASPDAVSSAPTSGAAATSSPSTPSSRTPSSSVAPADVPAATAAGRYTYTAKGTVTVGTPQPVDSEAVLTVDPVSGGQQHSVLDGEQGRTEQDVVLRADGRYLANLSLTNPAFNKQFRPDPSVLLLPTPTTVGRSWEWTATSTDGKTTARASNRVVREEVLTVSGERVECAVVQTTLMLSGDLTYRGETTTWVSSRYALPVQDRTRGKGTVSGVAFSTDITTALRSTQPA